MVIYNFSRTITATPEELLSFELSSRKTGGAFFAGVLYLFGFTSSVFHLCFMGSLRLVAVLFPLRYKFMRDRTILICLVGVWLLSAVAATMPGKLQDDFFKDACSRYSKQYQTSLLH